MRYLHLLYYFMPLIAGCLLGKYLLKSSIWRWAVFLLVINAGMFAAQRELFAGSEHLELPGRATANPWLQAFTWIRQTRRPMPILLWTLNTWPHRGRTIIASEPWPSAANWPMP
jgi:hypothetical protein